MSVLRKETAGLISSDLYENGEPKKGGPIDTRFGITDNHLQCDTCGLGTNFCVGHFGHIELSEPVFHLGFLESCIKILKCINF